MGKQIRIYLADGTPSGIKHAEITNWTGQALACPRSRFQELREWSELKRPGVYFLFGKSEDTGEDAVYIGEAEIVLERLTFHFSQKDFWDELIAFTSKDDNLTNGHVRYLEAKLIDLAVKGKRYKVINIASPQLPALPRADRDAMDEYIQLSSTLLGVLGHKVLEKLRSDDNSKLTLTEGSSSEQSVTAPKTTSVQSTNPIFKLSVNGLTANAVQTDEGIVVLTGSEASIQKRTSLTGKQLEILEDLRRNGVLIQNGNKLEFTRDHLFSSPSQAATVIVGYSINGRENWKLPDGTTFTEYENKITESLLNSLSSTI